MAGAIALFDLYYLLVENIFGSVLMSGLGLTILFAIMGFATRMSPSTLILLLAFFVGTFSIGYAGELAAILIFIPAFMYFVIGLGRFIMRRLEAY